MNTTAMKINGLLLAGTLLAACGCDVDPTQGYTTRSQYPKSVRTVAVPIWTLGKEVFRRDLQFQLTEALIKRLEASTPYKVVDKTRADTELRGSIDNVSQRVLSFNPDSGQPRELEITYTVSFTWTDLRSGKVLTRRKNFRQSGSYIPPAPFGENFFQGSEDLINKLAERIVDQMALEW
jgi:outer membrane lipopolysaccharide assembly protein LptE/RlpB